MRQRIVFLDIDGVLNTPTSPRAPFAMDEANVWPLISLFDEIEELGIGAVPDIVISSSWRHGSLATWDRHIRKALAEAGWADAPIIGRTPELPEGRGAEIQAWLIENFGEDFAEHVVFAILDDDIHDMLDSQLPFVVKCETERGLTRTEIRTLKEILGNFSYEEWIEALDIVRGLDNVWVIDRNASPEVIEQQIEDALDAVRQRAEEQDNE